MNKKKFYYIRLTVSIIVLLLSIAAVLGLFYPFKFLDFQFLPVFERTIFDFSVLSLILFLAITGLTLLFGRFYCSCLCPFGIMQEIFSLISKKKKAPIKNYPIKYFILAVSFGFLVGGTTFIIKYIDPYTIFSSSFNLTVFGIVALVLVLILTLFKNRFFCSNICPIGAILGLISKFSINKIYIDKKTCVSCSMCEKACPTGAINSKEKFVDSEICINCMKCLGECKLNGIHYGIKPKEKVPFSLNRRKLIIFTAASAVFLGAIKLGIETTKILGEKIKNVILPPGSVSEKRMINKCINCNLCIQNCPNKILEKANDNFGAVHINYKKGKGYCEFNCNECSKTCPTGAIKKITLNEKQKTRIAMASINFEKCVNCKICALNCPTGAIIKENGKIKFDAAKCIGCGKCKTVCPNGAIEIYSIYEQGLI